MSDDLTKLREEFNKHQIENAHFESSTAAYIKDAAQDIKDVKMYMKESTGAQWAAVKELREGMATEKEERKVEDVKLKGRIDGYAKVVAILTTLTMLAAGAYIYVGVL